MAVEGQTIRIQIGGSVKMWLCTKRGSAMTEAPENGFWEFVAPLRVPASLVISDVLGSLQAEQAFSFFSATRTALSCLFRPLKREVVFGDSNNPLYQEQTMSGKVKLAIVVVGLTLTAGNLALADAAPYSHRPIESNRPVERIRKMVIKVDADARIARLQIPETLLSDEPNASNSAPSGRMLFAGLAMSMTVGSVFFLNRRNRYLRGTVVSALGLAAIFAASGVIQADMPGPFRGGRPLRYQRNAPRVAERQAEILLEAGIQAGTNVVCELVPNCDDLTLILPARLQSIATFERLNPSQVAPTAPAANDPKSNSWNSPSPPAPVP
jgi:hypothetical protein